MLSLNDLQAQVRMYVSNAITLDELEDYLIESAWWDHVEDYRGDRLELIGSIEFVLYAYRARYLSDAEARKELSKSLPPANTSTIIVINWTPPMTFPPDLVMAAPVHWEPPIELELKAV